MRTFIDITTLHGQFYYDLSYFLAIVFAGIFFILDGKRKKYPMAEWSFLFASGILFLIIGTKLFTYTASDWRDILESGTFPYTARKTILGGIIGGIFGIGLAKRLIRFPHPVLDSFAVSFPIAMGIQRIGCFLVGCCYGTVTDVPWSVRYIEGTLPYYRQLEHGLVTSADALSLPIHPNQLYQSLLCFLIAFIIWRWRNAWKRPGHLFFSSIVLYWLARFFVEFWRSPDANVLGGASWMGLKQVQWALLLAALVMTAVIIVRERTYFFVPPGTSRGRSSVWPFLGLCMAVVLLSSWLTRVEFLFMEGILIPAFLFQTGKAFTFNSHGQQYRLSAVYGLLFVLVISGTVTGQKMYDQLQKSKTTQLVLHDIQAGYGNLTYSHYHAAPLMQSGCEGTYYIPNGPEFIHQSEAYGVSYTRTAVTGPDDWSSWGGSIAGGRDKDQDSELHRESALYDFSVHGSIDRQFVGLGMGLHIGKGYVDKVKEGIYYTEDDAAKGYFNISGHLRLFPLDVFYLEYRVNEGLPYQSWARGWRTSELLMGSGLGMKNGSGIELGVEPGGPFVCRGKAMIQNKYGITASVYWKKNKEDEISRRFPNLSLTYRITGKQHR